MILHRPTVAEIELYCRLDGVWPHAEIQIPTPTDDEDEWHRDHTAFFLRVLFPQIRPPPHVRRICTEAILTRVQFQACERSAVEARLESVVGYRSSRTWALEQICDGSSLVPDRAYPWGNCKDPWSMGHDVRYLYHHLGVPDCYGRMVGLLETHREYRDGWLAQHSPGVGWLWFLGLVFGGWVAWRWGNGLPEPVRAIMQDGNVVWTEGVMT